MKCSFGLLRAPTQNSVKKLLHGDRLIVGAEGLLRQSRAP